MVLIIINTLGTTVTHKPEWELNISLAEKRLYFLWQMKKFHLSVKMLVNFYSVITKSNVFCSITGWLAVATTRDKQQHIVNSAGRVISCNL